LEQKFEVWLSKHPLLDFIRTFLFRLQRDQIFDIGAQVTYYMLLALFPFLIFLLGLLKYVPIDFNAVIGIVTNFMPEEASELILGVIDEIRQTGGITMLSFSMLTTLWSASRGSNALIKGLNKAYDVEEDRSFFKVRGVAILSTVGVPLMIIVSFLFLVFGELIGSFVFGKLNASEYFLSIWNMLRYLIPISGMIVYFMFFYKFAPNRRLSFKEVIFGALFASIGWIVVSMLFSFYVGNFGNFSRVYGSLGSVIVLLLWLYISSNILILGGEINAILAQKRALRK